MRKISENQLNRLPKPTERMQRLEDNLMQKLFDPKIMKAVLNMNHMNIMHDPANNKDTTLLDRVINPIEKTKNASVFKSDVDKEEMIENTIMDFSKAIIPWLTDDNDETLLIIADQYETIGHGITYRMDKLQEYTTQTLNIVLKKDNNNPAGFKCTTAYPNITENSTTKTPTGRNLIPDLSQTRTFRKSNTAERKALINAAIKGMRRKLKPMEQVYADIVTDPSFNDRMDISFNGSEITIRQLYELGHNTLHITPDKVNIISKTAHAPEIIKLKKLAQNRLNAYLGKNFNTTEPKKQTRAQKVALIEARFGNISTQKTDDKQHTPET